MSLIVVVRLQSGELLFVADRCVSTIDATGEVLNHSATTLKLHELNGGVIGAVGDPGMALTFIEKIGVLPVVSSHASHIQQRLADLLAEHLRGLTEAVTANPELADTRQKIWRSCSYVFGAYDGARKQSELIVFSPETIFTAGYEKGNVTLLGASEVADRLLHFFQRDSYTLEQGQRLATLLALATHQVLPNTISRDVDMWKLGDDGIMKYGVEDIRSKQALAQRILDRMRTDLYDA